MFTSHFSHHKHDDHGHHKSNKPEPTRTLERYQRSFSVVYEGNRYQGYDISLGGVSFLSQAETVHFTKGQILSVLIYVSIDGHVETIRASLRIASLRVLPETKQSIYGCSFKGLTDADVVKRIIEGRPAAPTAPVTPSVPKPISRNETVENASELNQMLTRLTQKIQQVEVHAFDENTKDEAFRAMTVTALNEMKKLIATIHSA